MRKKITVLGIAFIFIISGFLSGVFAPLIRDIKVSAAPADHEVETASSMAITNLPDKEYKITDDVPAGKPTVENGEFTLSRRVGSRYVLVGVSSNTYPGYAAEGAVLYSELDTFENPGTYVYRFYTNTQYTSVKDGKFNGKSFHEYVITVTSSVYEIALPLNDKNILPNITIPNEAKSNPRHPEYKPEGQSGHVAATIPLVLPLPESLIDTKSRDMLALDGDADIRKEAIAALREVYGDTAVDTVLDDADKTTDEKNQALRDLVYGSMRIVFYGNGNTEYSRDTESDYTPLKLGIKNEEWRTFVPTKNGGSYYAEYYFEHIDNARDVNVSASLRTNNIIVEKPNATQTKIDNIKSTILFNASPTFSFEPLESNFKIGTEMTLPTATMTVSTDSDIQFDSESSITSYSFILVRYHSNTSSTFKYIDKNGEPITGTVTDELNDERLMRITNFKFTPKEIGTYQFIYFTTTIFGHGKSNDSEFSGQYVRHHLPRDLKISSYTQSPEIKWTNAYDYKYENTVLQGAVFGTDTETTKFADAENLEKYLPGLKTSNKITTIQKGEYLYIPALLGESKYTNSDILDYKLYLYKYDENNMTNNSNPGYVLWSSGLNGESTSTSHNGNVWDHTKPFIAPDADTPGIYFPNKSGFDSNDFLGSTNKAKWQGQTVKGKYDLQITVLDKNGISTSKTYTFEVVDGFDATRPKFNSLFKIGNQEYYENDTVKFNTANLTDTYTDDVNIEVKYYVSEDGSDIGKEVDGMTAAEIKNDTDYKGMSISNNIVSFELNENNPAGEYVLAKLAEDGGDSFQFRIYAVARNYHALVRNINIGSWLSTDGENLWQQVEAGSANARELTITEACRLSTETNPALLPYIVASHDSIVIYKMEYGQAAEITQAADTGEFSWGEFLDDQTPKQDETIAIPGLKFGYPGSSGYLSTITYEVVHKETNTPIGVISKDGDKDTGAGWHGNIGGTSGALTLGKAAAGDSEESQRYFTSSKIGLHWVIVKVTNAGGNIGIFVGCVDVKGIPQYSHRLVYDGVNTMKIGESKSMPSLEITIGNDKFVSGVAKNAGLIVTASEISGSQQVVGSYFITLDGGNYSKNQFVPLVQGTYNFVYNVTIDSLPGGDPFSFKNEELKITVGNIESNDIILGLETSRYNSIANGQTKLYGSNDYALTDSSDDFDPTKTNRYNFFTEMTVSGAEGKTLEMTDSQLYKGAEPSKESGAFDANMTWQYGRIYLPNESLNLKKEVSGLLNAPEFINAETVITVEYSNLSTKKTLLNTSTGSPTATQFVKDSVAQEGMYWFRPVGQLTPQYEKEEGVAYVPQDYNEALKYAANKDKWEPANGTAVDGEYTITYKLTFMGLTVEKKYIIAMGDTRKPVIKYVGSSSSNEDVFEKTYKVGDTMKFVFSKDTFNISGTKNDDFFWEIDSEGKFYLQNTQENSNVFIRISRDSGIPINVGEDNYAIVIDEVTKAETHSFKFTEAGTYKITFDIKGVSTWGSTTYSIKVSEKTPKTQIAPEEVLGTILIILSSGLLLGVIVYFIRTGQSTRFSSKRGTGAKKTKEEKPDVV